MNSKNNFKFFPKNSFITCYIVKFKNNNININHYEQLKNTIKWSKFGKTSYHAYCELSGLRFY